jgi:hypothetical protein
MAMLDAHQKRMTACFGQTEANTKIEQNPDMMQSAEEHQDMPNEDVAVMLVAEPRKRRRSKELIACLGETDANTEKIELNPGMMQSVEEHQDIPSEDVTVMPLGEPRKQRRGRKLTARRRGEPKEPTRENCGFLRKLAVACRKVSRYATVAWRKRKIFRKSETRGYCGSRKGVTVADRRTSHHATVAWQKRILTRVIWIEESGESLKDFEVNRVIKVQGCKNGIWCRDVKNVPDLKKERTTNGIKRWSAEQRSYLGSGRTPSKNPYEIFGRKIEKQVVRMSMGFLQIRIWRVWRCRPPPKRKKEAAHGVRAGNVGAPATH